jgi:hypothetical protein
VIQCSMDTEESVIFRKVERDLEVELKAREDDSDSDEMAILLEY